MYTKLKFCRLIRMSCDSVCVNFLHIQSSFASYLLKDHHLKIISFIVIQSLLINARALKLIRDSMIPIIHKFLYSLIQSLLSIPFFFIHFFYPFFYLSCLRFNEVHYKKSASPYLAIFVVYQKGSLPFYVKNIIEALTVNQVKVVVVVNGYVSADTKSYLESTCHVVIFRKNIGRDFGAYKDALSTVALDNYKKIFLINDSVLYFKKNLKELIASILKSQHQWTAIYDNYNVSYHAQSFFLCFGAEVFRSKIFKDFWSSYIPFSLRHYVIRRGELALASSLIKAGFVNYTVNNLSSLKSNLDALSSMEISDLKLFLTQNFVRLYPSVVNMEPPEFILYLAYLYKRVASPVHDLYPVFSLLNQSAIFKRDLIKRHKTTLDEFYSLLKKMKLDESEIQATMKEFSDQSKSSPKGLIAKINFRFDII